MLCQVAIKSLTRRRLFVLELLVFRQWLAILANEFDLDVIPWSVRLCRKLARILVRSAKGLIDRAVHATTKLAAKSNTAWVSNMLDLLAQPLLPWAARHYLS